MDVGAVHGDDPEAPLRSTAIDTVRSAACCGGATIRGSTRSSSRSRSAKNSASSGQRSGWRASHSEGLGFCPESRATRNAPMTSSSFCRRVLSRSGWSGMTGFFSIRYESTMRPSHPPRLFSPEPTATAFAAHVKMFAVGVGSGLNDVRSTRVYGLLTDEPAKLSAGARNLREWARCQAGRRRAFHPIVRGIRPQSRAFIERRRTHTIVVHNRASQYRARWPTLIVATMTRSPGWPIVAAQAANITSASRASGEAVGNPRCLASAQYRVVCLHSAVRPGKSARPPVATRSSRRRSAACAPMRVNSRLTS